MSNNTTSNMKSYNNISFIDNLNSDSALVFIVTDGIMNCVRSHISFSIWHPSLLLYSALPDDHALCSSLRTQ